MTASAGLIVPLPCRLVSGRRAGPFELFAQIASGRRSEAFVARADESDRAELVRILIDGEDRSAFERDAERGAQFGGAPELIDTKEALIARHRLVIGETLSTIIERTIAAGSPLPLDVSLAIGMGIAARLGHPKDEKVHGDLAPHHVLVGYDGAVHLVDAAGPIDGQIRSRAEGRQGYRSPEHITDKTLVPASDVFTLGVLLFEMTTGNRLFGKETHIANDSAITSGRYPRPRTLVGEDYPIELQVILRKMLRGSTKGRFSDGKSALDALRLIISGRKFRGAAAVSTFMHVAFSDRYVHWREAMAAAGQILAAPSELMDDDATDLAERFRDVSRSQQDTALADAVPPPLPSKGESSKNADDGPQVALPPQGPEARRSKSATPPSLPAIRIARPRDDTPPHPSPPPASPVAAKGQSAAPPTKLVAPKPPTPTADPTALAASVTEPEPTEDADRTGRRRSKAPPLRASIAPAARPAKPTNRTSSSPRAVLRQSGPADPTGPAAVPARAHTPIVPMFSGETGSSVPPPPELIKPVHEIETAGRLARERDSSAIERTAPSGEFRAVRIEKTTPIGRFEATQRLDRDTEIPSTGENILAVAAEATRKADASDILGALDEFDLGDTPDEVEESPFSPALLETAFEQATSEDPTPLPDLELEPLSNPTYDLAADLLAEQPSLTEREGAPLIDLVAESPTGLVGQPLVWTDRAAAVDPTANPTEDGDAEDDDGASSNEDDGIYVLTDEHANGELLTVDEDIDLDSLSIPTPRKLAGRLRPLSKGVIAAPVIAPIRPKPLQGLTRESLSGIRRAPHRADTDAPLPDMLVEPVLDSLDEPAEGDVPPLSRLLTPTPVKHVMPVHALPLTPAGAAPARTDTMPDALPRSDTDPDAGPASQPADDAGDEQTEQADAVEPAADVDKAITGAKPQAEVKKEPTMVVRERNQPRSRMYSSLPNAAEELEQASLDVGRQVLLEAVDPGSLVVPVSDTALSRDRRTRLITFGAGMVVALFLVLLAVVAIGVLTRGPDDPPLVSDPSLLADPTDPADPVDPADPADPTDPGTATDPAWTGTASIADMEPDAGVTNPDAIAVVEVEVFPDASDADVAPEAIEAPDAGQVAPVETTKVVIRAFPLKKAQVFADGKPVDNGAEVEVGATPVSIRITAAGYLDFEEVLEPGRTKALDVILSRKKN